MADYEEEGFVQKNIRINWDEINRINTDYILSIPDDKLPNHFKYMIQLYFPSTDPDATPSNIAHLFIITQFSLEFVIFSFYFYFFIFLLFSDFQ